MILPDSLFVQWVNNGKPRVGALYEQMYRTRASFKLALRFCHWHKELQADACAKSCIDNDPKTFWKNVSKIAKNKLAKFANTIGEAIGESDICKLWHRSLQINV